MKTIAILFIVTAPALAAPPLSGLPSAEGPTVAQIKALGDNAWLNLGSPAADPAWGKRRGASWTPKMAYAPDLRGAFVYGSGQHGFLKPDGHYQDDLWLYDINAHQWVCAWPGTKNTWVLHLDSNGVEVDSTGMPVPVARIGHGYELESYDPDLKKFVFMMTDDPYWGNSLPLRWNWIPSTSMYWTDGKYRCPFYYDVPTGKWERKFPATGTEMDAGRLESMVEYIPTIKKVFHLRYSNVWLYDYTSNAWTKIASPGAPAFGGYDGVMCYDGKRDRVYAGKGSEFKAYNVQARTWSTPAQSDVGSGVGANMTYDVANDVVLSHLYTGTKSFKVYNPSTDRWNPVATSIPVGGSYQFNAFYDPVLNVHFFFGAGDSYDNGVMLAYRYKKVSGSKGEDKTPVPAEKISIRVSPNPVRSVAAVQVNGTPHESAVQIFDCRGMRVARLKSAERWNAKGLSGGLYLVTAKVGNRTLSKRIFKE